MRSSILLAGGLVALAQAYTPPTTASWGPLLTPDLTKPVTQGEKFEVTWDPESHSTDDVTVSLVLCRGPSTNCVPDKTAIVEKVPASAKSYSWSVPCDLPAGTQATATGYGMLVIVDGTGEFQYSTQFSVLASDKCGSSSASASGSSTTSTASGYGPGSWTTKGWDSSYPSNATATIWTSSYATPVSYTSSIPVYSTVAVSTSGMSTYSAPSPTASEFTGAAALAQGNVNVIGLIAGGALAMFAL
jgi:Ser-Thr-rich glycosyl-phosphatidyl-inositol-anchored membrane family